MNWHRKHPTKNGWYFAMWIEHRPEKIVILRSPLIVFYDKYYKDNFSVLVLGNDSKFQNRCFIWGDEILADIDGLVRTSRLKSLKPTINESVPLVTYQSPITVPEPEDLMPSLSEKLTWWDFYLLNTKNVWLRTAQAIYLSFGKEVNQMACKPKKKGSKK